MKYLAIIQARCGSTRLPNKVLKELNGTPMLMKVVERVRMSKYVDEIIVATSIESSNLPLINICSKNGVRVFVGSENDVLDRFYQVAKLFCPEYVIRVTADCPLYDPQLLDDAIEQMDSSDDYLGDINEVYADGTGIEIIKYPALVQSWNDSKLMSEREHVTMYVKNNPDKFRIRVLKAKITGSKDMRLTVDKAEDFDLVSRIYANFIGRDDFFLEEIMQFLNRNPELLKLNSNTKRNEGLNKSLKCDKIVGE